MDTPANKKSNEAVPLVKNNTYSKKSNLRGKKENGSFSSFSQKILNLQKR